MNFTLAFSKASQRNKSENVKKGEIIEVILESKNEIQCFSYRYLIQQTHWSAYRSHTCAVAEMCYKYLSRKHEGKGHANICSKHLQYKSLQLSFSQSHCFHAACSHIRFHSENVEKTDISGS